MLLQSGKTFGVVLLACAASACGADGDEWNDPHLTTGASSSNEPGTSSSTPQTGTIPAEPDTHPTLGMSPSEQPSTTMTPEAPPSDSIGEEPIPPAGGEPPIPSSGTSTEMQPPPMPPAVTPPVDMPPNVSPEPDTSMFPSEPGPGISTQDSDAGAGAGVEPEPDMDDPTAMSGEEVPMTDHCAAVADWDPLWTQWEDEVLLLVNEYRAMGYNCDSQGSFEATTPVATDPMLRCAARLHSLDMYERGYFDHDNPDGVDPFERMAAAGFSGSYMGENIAQGQSSPEDVMRAWMESDGHCSNVMNPNYTLIGVGFHPGSDSDRRAQRYWTQNFGAPPRQGGGGRR